MEPAEKSRSAEELYDARQYWWWAEKKRSHRINYLRKGVWSKATKGSAWLPGVQLGLDNIRWQTKIFKEAPKAEPFIITRARALAEVLDNIPIFITDHSRIMGYPGGAPHLITWIPTASNMINDDLYNDRTNIIPEEDLEEVKEMIEYWKGNTYEDKCKQYFTPQREGQFDHAQFCSTRQGYDRF